MKRTHAAFVPSCGSVCFNTVVIAETRQDEADAVNVDPEQEAADAARCGDYGATLSAYEKSMAVYPQSVTLRLELTDALKRDCQWERPTQEYGTVLTLQPDNAEAATGIGTVRRWQANIDEAKRVCEGACTMAPQSSDRQFGLAATYALGHHYLRAGIRYEQAEPTWPEDAGVQQAADDFHRRRNPLFCLFWESDLSSATRQAGAIAPIAARDELGVEYQDATSYAPQLDDAEIYTRRDQRVVYTHDLRLSRMLDILQLTDRRLFQVGFPWDTTNRLSVGAKYITNPDLDYSINATAIAKGSCSLTETWSARARYRFDEYKAGTNQTGYYVAARFAPNSHWWGEFGLRQSHRNTASGTYGPVSVTDRF